MKRRNGSALADRRRHRALGRLVAAGVAAVAALATAACQPIPGTVPAPGGATTSVASTTSSAGDGTTEATAGVSCWGILRDHPSSDSGTYWVYTPAMDRPAQVYCDMTTGGGGWELVARGRNGWTFSPLGQGSAAQVRSAVSGTAAFAPAALDDSTIEALLNGADPSALSDGIRIERADNSTGTSHQQFTIFPRFTSWTWAWPAGQLLTKATINGVTYAGGNTRDTYSSVPGQTVDKLAGVQGHHRLFTFPWAGNGDVVGFSYGRDVTGTTTASTNLYVPKKGGYVLPFTRVWIRPRLSNATTGFPTVPAGGFTASPKPYALDSHSKLAPWGVTGIDHTGEVLTEPWNTNTVVVKADGPRVFVGGRFTGVKQGPSGATTAQRSLAAFDLAGNWISTFRPVVAGHVWDILVLANGNIVVAGDFTSINGNTDASGVAELDAATGAVVTTFKARVRNANGSSFRVRALAQHAGTIYLAGDFDQITGGTAAPLTVAGAIGVNATTGAPSTWRPKLAGGSAVRIRVNAAGTRVLLAGHFTTVNGSTNERSFAITDIATGANTAGIGAWAPSIGSLTVDYQQAVADLGDRIVVGGSQHDTQVWTPNRTKLITSDITKTGGDTQAIEVFGTHAFVGCHCGNWVYEGTNDFSHMTGFTKVSDINLVGMYDTATWTYDPSWYPAGLKGDAGEGVWSVDQAQDGCIWVGGDLDRGAYSGNAATDWLGGFARFCPLDSTPPSTPGALTVTSSGTARKLVWSASTDASGAVTYDVVRNGRVIATVSGLTYTDPNGAAGSTYTVRASDPRSNRSASPPPVRV